MDTRFGFSPTFLSRREFMKLSAISMPVLFYLPYLEKGYLQRKNQTTGHVSDQSYGRILKDEIEMYKTPSYDGEVLKTVWTDVVLPISDVVIGDKEPAHNRIWYQMNGEGYIHSSYVQPVEIVQNEPVLDLSSSYHHLAEVTVPYTEAVWDYTFPKGVKYRFYYGTTHWVTGAVTDDQGVVWYIILEDQYKFTLYVQAKHLRLVTEEELTPLSSTVPSAEKRIRVHLNDQTLIAYEADTPVYMMKVSSGTRMSSGEYLTPTGKLYTNFKRPSRHMVGGDPDLNNFFDLPGIPWVSFINEAGISFHGTYWHNDFGKPRSHGCINLPSPAAKWIYRWTLPAVPFDREWIYKLSATLVDISVY
jgi:lipoprotein-anchoring transpeptidase ErfK/SrfK